MRHTYLSMMTAAAIFTGAGAPAMAVTLDFSNPVTTGAQAPGVWYTDRSAPSGFVATGGQLIESISASDYHGGNFYDTQGRKYDLAPGTNKLSVDLTIDSSWASTEKRWAGLWGTALDSDSDVSAYPILEFTTDGGTARFRGYDSNDGTWQDLIPTGGITFGGTYTLNIALTAGNFVYSVGDATSSFDANGSTGISNVILQGYNTGTSYSIAWDNVNGAVPEPASWAMMLGGFGLVGGAVRRRRTTLRFA